MDGDSAVQLDWGRPRPCARRERMATPMSRVAGGSDWSNRPASRVMMTPVGPGTGVMMTPVGLRGGGAGPGRGQGEGRRR